MLAVTPPARGEPRAALLHDGRCSIAPARRGGRGRPRARGRPLAPLGLVVGGGGRPHRSWMPGCRSRGPGTSPRRTGSSTVGGARPPASAGRRRTASRWRACPVAPTGDLFEFAADAPPTEADSVVDAGGPPARRPGRVAARPRPPAGLGARRRWRPRTSSTTPPRRPRCGWSAPCSRSRRRRCCASSCDVTGCRSTGPAPSSCSPTPWARGRPRTPRRLASRRARDERGAAPRARARVDRPAQPGAGARDAARRGGRRAEHPQVGARALPHGAPGGRRAARLAARRADRHDLRLPVARRERRPRRPAAGAVDGLRRRGRADDGRERPAQPAGGAAPGRGRARGPRLRARRPRADRATGAGGGVRRHRVRGRHPGRRPLRAGGAAAGGGAAGGQGGGAGRDVRPAQRSGRRGAQGPRARLPGGDGPARAGGGRGAARRAAAHVRRAASSRPGGSSRRARSAPTRRWMPRVAGSRATRSSRGRRPSCSRRGRRRCGRRHATSGPRWCCACTTSCSCTLRPSTPPRWRRGSTGRSRTPPRRWAGGAPVRFVADTSVIARWSDAKD